MRGSLRVEYTICGVCGKRCYPSRRMAKIGMRSAHNKVRAYFAHGAGWHVTSQAAPDVGNGSRGRASRRQPSGRAA